jgi:hypothetical protein
MLLLTSVSDQLQVITDSTAGLDVHASWVDTVTSTGAITPGRTNTKIAAAATTSIAGSPAVSTQRNVKTLHVRNRDATLSVNVKVAHTDGTNAPQLYAAALPPNTMFEYTDQGGFTLKPAS